jgi:hypothetical protein
MNQLISKPKVKETTAMQIICVISYLWCIPVIDSLDSYSYGIATRVLLTSFIYLTLGVIISVNLPSNYNKKLGKSTLAISAVLLLFYFFPFDHFIHWWCIGPIRVVELFRLFGFILLGYGLRSKAFTIKIKSFWRGLVWLTLLYAIYNLLIYCGYNFYEHIDNPEMRVLWIGRDIAYGITRILIVVMLWQTLVTDSVQQFLNKLPKISLLVAGLFWGMILVMPANHYSPRWLAIVMLLLAPVIAYVMTIIVRLSFQMLSYLIKGILTNKSWWFKSCCWWIDKGANNESEAQKLIPN